MSLLIFVPHLNFRTPEYEFRTLSGCAVKMYQIWRFVLKDMVVFIYFEDSVHEVSNMLRGENLALL